MRKWYQCLFVPATPNGKRLRVLGAFASISMLLIALSVGMFSFAPAAANAVIASDTFQRANQSHWGTASDGQTWGGDANSLSNFSISGNAGLVSNTGSTTYSAVLGPTAADTEVYAIGSLSSFSNSNFGDVLRWTDGNNWYKAYIDGAHLIIQKKVAGTATMTSFLADIPGGSPTPTPTPTSTPTPTPTATATSTPTPTPTPTSTPTPTATAT